LAATALFSACSDGGSDDVASGGSTTIDSSDAASAFPVTITNGDREVTLDERPDRIVSLSSTGTEVLFAVGAGDQVVAVDEQSDYPPEAPITDLTGFTPNVEAIADYEPDLVVASFDPGELVASLEALDIAVVLHDAPDDLDGAYEQMLQLGTVTGHLSEAQQLVDDTKADIETLVAEVPDPDEPLTYFHELDDTLFTATSATFIGQIYALVGLENIADDAEPGNAYPKLSAEFVIDADPDFVFLADGECCGQSLETVAARPGWGSMAAVESGQVVSLNEDIVSRWGPRITEFLEVVVDALASAA
jgi:iron complex transport system substrate-binding protein